MKKMNQITIRSDYYEDEFSIIFVKCIESPYKNSSNINDNLEEK